MAKIGETELQEYGFIAHDGEWYKNLEDVPYPHEGYLPPRLMVTFLRGIWEFALSIGDGHLVFLNIESLEQLNFFEASINSIDSPHTA